MKEIVYVRDMAAVKVTNGVKTLLSRRGSRIIKDRILKKFHSGCGKVKDGKLYILSPLALMGEVIKDGSLETIRLNAIVVPGGGCKHGFRRKD